MALSEAVRPTPTKPYSQVRSSKSDLKLGYEGFQEIYSVIEKEIQELRNLEEDWDGEGGLPLLPEVGEIAKVILHDAMQNNTPPCWIKWVTPHFSPVYNGGLNLEWNVDGKRLAIIIKNTNEVRAVRRINGKVSKVELTKYSQIMELISWVMGSQVVQSHSAIPFD